MDSLTNQITNISLNEYNWVNHDPNEITNLIENVSDSQSDIILSLFTKLTNKMYLVNHRDYDRTLEIDLMGSLKTSVQKISTREKYTIIFKKSSCKFACNCKDFKYRSISHNIVCKHITFIICKILGIYDNTFFENKTLSSDYKERMYRVLNNPGIYNNCPINYEEFNKSINSEFENNQVKTLNTKDTCPICYDMFSDKKTVSCPTCHNYVHKECIQIWLNTSKSCIYCRSYKWKNYSK